MKRWLIAATLLTLVISVFIFIQAMSENPLLHVGVPGQWTWRYDHSPFGDRALMCLAGAALLGGLCHWTRERIFELQGGRLTSFLLAAFVLCFWLQASFAYLSRSGFGSGVFWMGTPKANVDFAEACKAESMSELFREAQNPERPFRIHISTHPPGPTLFYYFQRRAWESMPGLATSFAAITENSLTYAAESRAELEQGILNRPLTHIELATLYSSILILWLAVAFGVVPLFFWATDLFNPGVAVAAVGLYALMPSLLLFNPMTDQLYVPLALGLLATYHLGLARRDQGQLIFAGVLTWIALQFTLAFLVILFLFAIYVGLEMYFEKRVRDILTLLAWPFGAFVAMIVVCFAARYNCLLVWKLCLANNAHFNTDRTYLPWLIFNPIDFALFVGVPVALFFARGVGRAIMKKRYDPPWRFVMALSATLVIVNVSGINRGEVARLWMFLMPMAALVAASRMRAAEDETDWQFPICFGLLFVQSVLFKLSFDLLLPSL